VVSKADSILFESAAPTAEADAPNAAMVNSDASDRANARTCRCQKDFGVMTGKVPNSSFVFP
jgi:hypothetical protein